MVQKNKNDNELLNLKHSLECRNKYFFETKSVLYSEQKICKIFQNHLNSLRVKLAIQKVKKHVQLIRHVRVKINHCKRAVTISELIEEAANNALSYIQSIIIRLNNESTAIKLLQK